MINQKVALKLLQREGHSVTIASNGEEAVKQYTANPSAFDVILMDLHMPQMDGLEATVEIRRAEEREAAKALQQSSSSSSSVARTHKTPPQHMRALAMTQSAARARAGGSSGHEESFSSQAVIPPLEARRIPIIAVTASAMEADKKACLSAGMNGKAHVRALCVARSAACRE